MARLDEYLQGVADSAAEVEQAGQRGGRAGQVAAAIRTADQVIPANPLVTYATPYANRAFDLAALGLKYGVDAGANVLKGVVTGDYTPLPPSPSAERGAKSMLSTGIEQGPAFAAAKAKFDADPRALTDLGYITPSSPLPLLPTDMQRKPTFQPAGTKPPAPGRGAGRGVRPQPASAVANVDDFGNSRYYDENGALVIDVGGGGGGITPRQSASTQAALEERRQFDALKYASDLDTQRFAANAKTAGNISAGIAERLAEQEANYAYDAAVNGYDFKPTAFNNVAGSLAGRGYDSQGVAGVADIQQQGVQGKYSLQQEGIRGEYGVKAAQIQANAQAAQAADNVEKANIMRLMRDPKTTPAEFSKLESILSSGTRISNGAGGARSRAAELGFLEKALYDYQPLNPKLAPTTEDRQFVLSLVSRGLDTQEGALARMEENIKKRNSIEQ